MDKANQIGFRHIAFEVDNIEEANKKAQARGLRVTGSELVGLIPKQAMIDAGKYFLRIT